MFHSEAVTKQWDTWAFVENGTFYAYYLVTEVSYGEGFGVATSSDGQHWNDHGYVWHGPSWVQNQEWQGTSSVWRAPDFNKTGRYQINYSVMKKDGHQQITFAESFDLINWFQNEEPYNNTWFDIDEAAGYKLSHGRWDTIYSIPIYPGLGLRDAFPRYGFWTASPVEGTMGFGITLDGTTWQALPSPKMLPEPIGAEVGAVEPVLLPNGTWTYYAMLGYGWPRTVLTYHAARPEGPYVRAEKNLHLINGSMYYPRFFRGPNQELLVTHQSWTNRGSHFSYIAPYKLVDVDEEGTLRLKHWPANEAFKGDMVAVGWDVDRSSYLAGLSNVTEGAVVEAQFAMPTEEKLPQWPGFLLEYADLPGALCVLLQPDGLVAVGDYVAETPFNYSATPAAVPTHDIMDWAFDGGASSADSRAPWSSGSDIRSGYPGGSSTAYLAHPLDSQGHILESVDFAFQYVAGYTPPEGQSKSGSVVSLALLDAFNHSVIRTLWTSEELSNYSYDRFTTESPPVTTSLRALGISWSRQMQFALIIQNNDRNLQIPMETLNVSVGWGGLQPGPYMPEPPTALVTILERWERALTPAQLGSSVKAKLIYRRDMLELYINDFLYPVYSFPTTTGRIGVTNNMTVTNVQRWRISEPELGPAHPRAAIV